MIQGERFCPQTVYADIRRLARRRVYYISVGHRGLFELGLDTSAGDPRG